MFDTSRSEAASPSSQSGESAAAQVQRNAQRVLAVLCLLLGGVALEMGEWTTAGFMAVVVGALGMSLR